MFTTVTILIVLIFMCYLWFKKTYNYWNDRGIIGPKPLPIVGNFATVMSGKEHLEDYLQRLYDDFPNEKYIGIYQAWIPALIIKDLDMIKHILTKESGVFRERGMKSLYPFHNNVIMSRGDSWYVLRSFMNSLFTLGKLKIYIPLLEESAEKHSKYISGLLERESVQDVQHLFDAFMLQANMLCLFGTEVDAGLDQKGPVTDFFNEFFNPGVISRCIFYGDIIFEGLQKVASILKIDPRVNKIKKHFTPLLNKVLEDKNKRQTSFLDRIDKMQNEKFTQQNYENKSIQIENTDTFILTQAFIMFISHIGVPGRFSSMVIYELALNQDLQDRLYREINQVSRKHNSKVTYESLNEMTYLDMVIEETIRKHFAVPIVRLAASDYEFPEIGLNIKKGTYVMIPSQGLHMDPKYFKNAEVFDPERFSVENRKKIHDCTFLPFGMGPRKCLGTRVAELLMKFSIASFLSKFKVEPCEKTIKTPVFASGITKMKVDGGIWLNITARSDSL